jgi:hypothetical protein
MDFPVLSTPRAEDLEPNRRLMIMLTCEPGTLSFIDAEGQLINALVATGWLPEQPMLEVCAHLIPEWRTGRVYDLKRDFVCQLQRELDRPGRRRLVSLFNNQANPKQLPPADILEILDIAERVRKAVSHEDRALFEAWIESKGDLHQSDYGRTIGRPPTWVHNHLKRLKAHLDTVHGIADPEAFAELVAELRDPPDTDPAGDRPPARPVGPERPAGTTIRLRAGWFHERLIEKLAGRNDWSHCLEELELMTTWTARNAAFPEDAQSLAGLHEGFEAVLHEIRHEDGLAAFFKRVGEGRNNLAQALAETRPRLSNEEIQACEAILEAAKENVSFELPTAGFLRQLDAAHKVFRAWDRQHRQRPDDQAR